MLNGPRINKTNFKKPFCKDFLPKNGFIKVKFLSIVDGDTAYFEIHGFRELVRFNVIDAPAVYPDPEYLGEEASLFALDILQNANEIYLESDLFNNLRDDTLSQRLLAWIWVDKTLLNYQLVRNGLATVKYIISPKMKYIGKLKSAEKKAKKEHLGIYKC